MDTGYMSFLVRLWPAREAAGAAHCIAEVEHIQSGRCWSFPTASEAWDFLCAVTVDPSRLQAPSTR